MPVWKYRCVEDMPPPPCYEPGSESHLRQWAALWARATQISGARFEPGVFRYHGVEDPRRAEPHARRTAADASSPGDRRGAR